MKNICNINHEHPLGKGEVVSSILTGSTREAHEIGTSGAHAETYSAVSSRTEREDDISKRGENVDSVHAAFCVWLDRQESANVYQRGRWVEMDLRYIIDNGPETTLVRGLAEHVKQLEAAVRSGQ